MPTVSLESGSERQGQMSNVTPNFTKQTVTKLNLKKKREGKNTTPSLCRDAVAGQVPGKRAPYPGAGEISGRKSWPRKFFTMRVWRGRLGSAGSKRYGRRGWGFNTDADHRRRSEGGAEFQSVVVAVVVQSLNKQASHRYTGTANATSWASQRPQRNISSASHFEEVLKKLALAAL